MQEIRGYIKKIDRKLDSGDLIVIVEYEGMTGMVDSKAIGPFNMLGREGDWFVAKGRFTEGEYRGRPDPKFQATNVMPDLPRTKESAVLFLRKNFTLPDHGIDEEAIAAFVGRHGADAAFKADKNPAILLEMSNSPETYERAIRSTWAQRVSGMEPIRVMEAAGAKPELYRAVMKRYKDATLDIIKRNPYELMAVKEVTFAFADRIAEQLGMPRNDPRRVSAGIIQVVNRSLSEGNTYVPVKGLRSQVEGEFDISWDDIKGLSQVVGTYEGATKYGWTIVPSKMGQVVQKFETYKNEHDIASHVTRMIADADKLDQKTISRVAEEILASEKYNFLSDEQRDAVRRSSRECIAILTGGPGTGKSTVSEAIADIASHPDVRRGPLLLVAPTGKAARRLAEATGRPTQTIHKLLGAMGEYGDFRHGKNNPLPAGCFVLVDESSMLDTNIARCLLDALPADGRLLLVGDKDQLPSVDAGYVIGDLLTAKADNGNMVPSAQLTQVFRQKGKDNRISIWAKEIKEGKFTPESLTTYPTYGVAFFRMDADMIAEQTKFLFCNRLREKFNYDPMKHVGILCPQRSGHGGTHQINRVVQQAFNPAGQRIEGWRVPEGTDPAEPVPRVLDRVMFTNNDSKLGIYNGDVGQIMRVKKDIKKPNDPGNIEVLLESGDLVSVPINLAPYCTVVAYAITGHKSQGSQYDVVIMPMSPDHERMLERTLTYTEWTRAKKMVILIGSEQAFRASIDNVTSTKRLTLLKSRVEDMLDALPPRPKVAYFGESAAQQEDPDTKARPTTPPFLQKSSPFASPFGTPKPALKPSFVTRPDFSVSPKTQEKEEARRIPPRSPSF